jgi:hypothetical protein
MAATATLVEMSRVNTRAGALSDGRVLVVGEYSKSTWHASAEVWDPATDEFSATGTTAVGRLSPTATVPEDGRVLVAAVPMRTVRSRMANCSIRPPARSPRPAR